MYAYNKVQELYSCNNARRNEMNFFVINAKSMTQAEKARLYLARKRHKKRGNAHHQSQRVHILAENIRGKGDCLPPAFTGGDKL